MTLQAIPDQLPTPHPLVVGLGESLFDEFPDRRVLGGAPLNVAIHTDALLRPLGGAALPVTRIGKDAPGEELLAHLTNRSISTKYVQQDPQRTTGRVDVLLTDAGDAQYTFATHSAWDAIVCDQQVALLAARCDAVTFGTLAQRSPASRGAIHEFLSLAPQAIRLFDVNLRQTFFDAEQIDASLKLASAAKVNQQELLSVTKLLELANEAELSATETRSDQLARRMVEAYQLDWLALTQGAAGTSLYTPTAKHQGERATAEPIEGADTVGAGDACSAGLLCGRLLGWSNERTLTLANQLGAHVASRPGATPKFSAAILQSVSRPNS